MWNITKEHLQCCDDDGNTKAACSTLKTNKVNLNDDVQSCLKCQFFYIKNYFNIYIFFLSGTFPVRVILHKWRKENLRLFLGEKKLHNLVCTLKWIIA